MVFTYAEDVQENINALRDRKEIRAFRVRKFVSIQGQERDKSIQSQESLFKQRQERDKSIQSQEICIQSGTESGKFIQSEIRARIVRNEICNQSHKSGMHSEHS